MIATSTAGIDFLVRLRKIDNANLKSRDIIILWAIAHTPGMMGLELARKIGMKTRSNVQIPIRRMIEAGLIEDRRRVKNLLTPNDLHILPYGEKFLADIMPS